MYVFVSTAFEIRISDLLTRFLKVGIIDGFDLNLCAPENWKYHENFAVIESFFWTKFASTKKLRTKDIFLIASFVVKSRYA